MGSNEVVSRKELSGWGDGVSSLGKHYTPAELPTIIDPELEKLYGEELDEVITIILEGLHLEHWTVKRRKYTVDIEDTEEIDEPLQNILHKRALKKLSHILN